MFAGLVNLGMNGCTRRTPCIKCQGDCNTDDDCINTLLCFQRNATERVHGCIAGGHGDTPGTDFCFDVRHNDCVWCYLNLAD